MAIKPKIKEESCKVGKTVKLKGKKIFPIKRRIAGEFSKIAFTEEVAV